MWLSGRRMTTRPRGPAGRYTGICRPVVRRPLNGNTVFNMGKAFTASDWELVRVRATAVGAQMRAKGATVWDFAPLPPVRKAQLDQFTRQTGLAMPGDFADLLTKFAGGWKFYWNLSVKKTDSWLKPPVFMGNFGGNAEVPFIGATAKETLLDRYHAFQFNIRNSYLDDPGALKVVPALFPLHTWDGGGGDYTVLRLDVSPARVYYLDPAPRSGRSSARCPGRGRGGSRRPAGG